MIIKKDDEKLRQTRLQPATQKKARGRARRIKRKKNVPPKISDTCPIACCSSRTGIHVTDTSSGHIHSPMIPQNTTNYHTITTQYHHHHHLNHHQHAAEDKNSSYQKAYPGAGQAAASNRRERERQRMHTSWRETTYNAGGGGDKHESTPSQHKASFSNTSNQTTTGRVELELELEHERIAATCGLSYHSFGCRIQSVYSGGGVDGRPQPMYKSSYIRQPPTTPP